MSSRRTLILIAAVVVGVLSAVLVFNYVNGADDRAEGNAARVPVLVVKKDIPRGLTGREALAQGYVTNDEIQSRFKPRTAINDKGAINNDNVAIAPLASGQIVVEGMFVSAAESSVTFAGRVPESCGAPDASGKPAPCVAITISVDQVKGVAGVVAPGDFVNILVNPDTGYCLKPNGTGAGATVDIPSAKGSIISKLDAGQPNVQPDGGVAVCNPARVLYQSVRVLFVDKTAVPQPGEVQQTSANGTASSGAATTNVNTGLITLAVPAKASQVIASVVPDEIYLTLLPPNYVPQALPKLDPYPSLLPGEDAGQLTPYGPQGIQQK